MRHPLLLLAVLCLTVSSSLQSQSNRQVPVRPGQYGFLASDTKSSAGILCSGFSCTVGGMTTAVGRTLSLSVRAPLKTRYLVLIGTQGKCISLPGFYNSWIVRPILLVPGTCNNQDNIRCWGGVGTTSVKVPSGLPKGFTVDMQGLVEAKNAKGLIGPVFTGAVSIKI